MSLEQKKRERSETSSTSFLEGNHDRAKKINQSQSGNVDEIDQEQSDDDLFVSEKKLTSDTEITLFSAPLTTRLRNRSTLKSVDTYDETRRPSTSSNTSKKASSSNKTSKSSLSITKKSSQLTKISNKKNNLIKKNHSNNSFARGKNGQNMKTHEIINSNLGEDSENGGNNELEDDAGESWDQDGKESI